MSALGSLAADAAKTPGFHLCICELNLLGDPTLDMRARDPLTPKLSVPAAITTGAQKLRITSDAPGATLCLWKGVEVYAVLGMDANGAATVDVTPTSEGPLLVTIAGPSLNTTTTSIDVR